MFSEWQCFGERKYDDVIKKRWPGEVSYTAFILLIFLLSGRSHNQMKEDANVYSQTLPADRV